MNRFFIILMLLMGINLAQAQQKFTLEEAIQYAIQNNSQLKVAQLDIADAEHQIKEFRAIGMPKLSAAADYSYFIDIPTQILPNFLDPSGPMQEVQFGTKNNVNGSLNANALIFDGSFFTGMRAQKFYKSLIHKQIDASAFEIKNTVVKAYLNIIISIRNKNLFDLNIDNLSKTLAETKAIYEQGFIEKLDVERLELSLENLKLERENVDRLIDVSYNLLKFQMGYPMDKEISIDENIDLLVNDAIAQDISEEEIDFTKRPEYDVLKAAEKMNELQVEVLKKGYYPSLFGFATHQQTLYRNKLFSNDESGWLPTTVVGLQLNVPIFDGMDRKYKIERAKVSQEKHLLNIREFERGMTLEIQNAKINYLNAKQRVENMDKMMQLSEKIYKTTQIKYREGVGSSLEVSQAEADVYQAQSNYVAALYQLLLAKADLDKAFGTL